MQGGAEVQHQCTCQQTVSEYIAHGLSALCSLTLYSTGLVGQAYAESDTTIALIRFATKKTYAYMLMLWPHSCCYLIYKPMLVATAVPECKSQSCQLHAAIKRCNAVFQHASSCSTYAVAEKTPNATDRAPKAAMVHAHDNHATMLMQVGLKPLAGARKAPCMPGTQHMHIHKVKSTSNSAHSSLPHTTSSISTDTSVKAHETATLIVQNAWLQHQLANVVQLFKNVNNHKHANGKQHHI
eukprot:GHRR01004894.1.p1 GENE.GHRR01004894.1~~GHRR01004894.1.p1  ORF type:complete len:240 (-),score=46.29 GHRR01004894.1:823-1542(-)